MSPDHLLSRRAFFFMAQDGVCCLQNSFDCMDVNGRMDPRARTSNRYATWDHVHPRSKGGGFPFNTLLACRECNHARGTSRAPSGLEERAHFVWLEWQKHVAQFGVPRGMAARKPPSIRLREVVDCTMGVEDEEARRERRMARAKELGITDPRYLPGAKRVSG